MAIIASGLSKIKRHDIVDENGDKLGEISYNPTDINAIQKYFTLYNKCKNGQRQLNNKVENLNIDILAKELESADEFAEAENVTAKFSEALNFAVDTVDDVFAEVDGLFGEGTCQMFTQGCKDPNMLLPLFEATFPDFTAAAEERQTHVNKYKRKKPTTQK